jgi:hypothetical protein
MRARSVRPGPATRLAATTLLAATLAVAGCSPGTELLNTSSGLTFTADPASLLLSPGETKTIVVNSVPIGPVLGTVKWASSDPRVVTIDSLVPIGAPATARAVGAGTASLRATISSAAIQSTLSVAVRVQTR